MGRGVGVGAEEGGGDDQTVERTAEIGLYRSFRLRIAGLRFTLSLDWVVVGIGRQLIEAPNGVYRSLVSTGTLEIRGSPSAPRDVTS